MSIRTEKWFGGDVAPLQCSADNAAAAARAHSAVSAVTAGMGAPLHRTMSNNANDGRALRANGRRARIFATI